MGSWREVRLGAHADIRARIGWRGLSANEYVDSGPFLIAGKHIISGSVDWNACDHLTEYRYRESPEIALQAGDVIVSKDGTIGRVARIDSLPGPATLNGTMMLVRPKASLDHRYLSHVLNGQSFKKLVDERVSGSSVPHLFQRDLVTLPMSLPPLQDQRRIAEVLDTIDETIQATQRVVAKKGMELGGLAAHLMSNSSPFREWDERPLDEWTQPGCNSVREGRVEGGGGGLVGHVGLHALGLFADRLGVGASLSCGVRWGGERAPGHDRGKVLTQAMLMLAGGEECCSDIEYLRAEGGLFGAVASAPTLYRTVRGLSPATVGDLWAHQAAVREQTGRVGRRRRGRWSWTSTRRWWRFTANTRPARRRITRAATGSSVVVFQRRRRRARRGVAPRQRGRQQHRRPHRSPRRGDRAAARRGGGGHLPGGDDAALVLSRTASSKLGRTLQTESRISEPVIWEPSCVSMVYFEHLGGSLRATQGLACRKGTSSVRSGRPWAKFLSFHLNSKVRISPRARHGSLRVRTPIATAYCGHCGPKR